MSWWGKVIGSAFGFVLVGPLGAVLGAAIGHSFDKGLNGLEGLSSLGVDQQRIQTAFFTATFSIMGQVAKADGRVSETELQVARQIMAKMQLSEDQRIAAIHLFNQGKAPGFDYVPIIKQFRDECGRRKNLLRMFMEIQLATALADNELHWEEQNLLLSIAEMLGFQRRQFEELLAMVAAQRRFSEYGGFSSSEAPDQNAIEQAYLVLGVQRKNSDAEVKKAYRKLMSQHHPDKLVSKGLPEEMMKIATAKTREIKEAYELIKRYRAKTS